MWIDRFGNTREGFDDVDYDDHPYVQVEVDKSHPLEKTQLRIEKRLQYAAWQCPRYHETEEGPPTDKQIGYLADLIWKSGGTFADLYVSPVECIHYSEVCDWISEYKDKPERKAS